MAKHKFFQLKEEEKEDVRDIYNFERGITSHDKKESDLKENNSKTKINTNQQNGKEYSDHIHINESPGKEFLLDRNNPFVRILLAIMGLIAILGTIYYIYIYVTTM